MRRHANHLPVDLPVLPGNADLLVEAQKRRGKLRRREGFFWKENQIEIVFQEAEHALRFYRNIKADEHVEYFQKEMEVLKSGLRTEDGEEPQSNSIKLSDLCEFA